MKTLFVIPARGGSKGIPHKNIRPLAGKPLIGYAIDTARHFADDCDICLSTDDPEIAAVATGQFGLAVPFLRPAELATDKSGTYEVLLHALDYYRNRGIDYECLVLLQPTSPFRAIDDVRRLCAGVDCRILHCYRITGERAYVIDAVFADMEALHAFLPGLDALGSHEVHIVLDELRDPDA